MMRKVTLSSLLQDYEVVKGHESYKYLAVFVSVDGAKPEMIVNPRENVEAKILYYRTAYDSNLRLKANPKIQIVDYQFATGVPSLDEYYNLSRSLT